MARNYYLTLLLFWQLHPEKIKHISGLLQSRNSPVKVRKYGSMCYSTRHRCALQEFCVLAGICDSLQLCVFDLHSILLQLATASSDIVHWAGVTTWLCTKLPSYHLFLKYFQTCVFTVSSYVYIQWENTVNSVLHDVTLQAWILSRTNVLRPALCTFTSYSALSVQIIYNQWNYKKVTYRM